MAGGLLNLVAVGDQNVIVHGNPDKTFFTSTFKTHTNFGLQKFRLDYEGQKVIHTTEETKYSFKVKRYADLLMETYLSINLPDIFSPVYPPKETQDSSGEWVPYEFKWIKNLGVQIIKEISVTVGGTTLCTIPGEFFLVNYNKNGYGKTGTLNIMTGNERKFYDPGKGGRSYPNAVYTANSDGAEPSIRGEQLLIPLNLWWTVSYKQAFPLVSLQYNELYINVTLRPLKEWFIIRDVLDKTNNYPYTAPNFNRSEQQFYHFLQSPPNVELNYTNKNVTWNSDIHIIANYCFLSEDERTNFATNEQQYLIKQVFLHTYNNISTANKIWLQNSKGLVTDFTFVYQRNDVHLRNEWSNFTNWPYEYQPYRIRSAPAQLDGSTLFGDRALGPGENPDYTPTGLYFTGDYKIENEKDILLSLGLILDGHQREEIRNANVYRYLEAYKRFSSTPYQGVYGYSFALSTSISNLQPTGSLNMSMFNKIELEFTTHTPTLDTNAQYNVVCNPDTGEPVGYNKPATNLYEYNYDLRIYEQRYNVLILSSGNASLMFAM
tara:strand:+ start:9131 stop:10774 length:1644 start_codon:yes stop_codon:yes gene_type:complete